MSLSTRESSIDYETALNTYFTLKTKYNDKYNYQKSIILDNNKLTKKEKKRKIRSIKMPCILCKKRVGTIFEDKDRIYSAVCGDRVSPCRLHIEIKKSKTYDLERMMEEAKKDIEITKYDIIKSKLALLFGFIGEDDLVKIYEGLQDVYQEKSKELNLIEGEYQRNMNLSEREKNIKELNLENYEAIKEIKSMMSEYLATNNVSILKDVIDKYVDVIVENNDRLRENRYHMNIVQVPFEANTGLERELVQKIKTIRDMEFPLETKEVIAFVV